MARYRINYTSTVCGYLEVEADSQVQAVEKFEDREEDYQYENCTEFDIDYDSVTKEG